MSQTPRAPHDRRFDEAVAAYALGALDPGERPEFETHLATCAQCQAELRELQSVSAGIGLAVEPVELPPALRARVLSAATAQAQVRPFPMRPERRSFAPWLAAAAAILVAALTGAYAWRLQNQSTADRADAAVRISALESRLAVMSAPDMVQVSLKGQPDAPASSARVFMSRTRGMVLNAEHLPALAAGRVYQLWVVTKQSPVSIGIFEVKPDGSMIGLMPVPADAANEPVAVAVTIEPSGGVPSPTGPKVLVGMVAPQ